MTMQREQSFDIEGMTCAACVRRVERRVAKVEGVADVVVNLATERMEVCFDSDAIDEVSIAAAVEQAGFRAQLCATETETSARQARKRAELEGQARQFWWAAAFWLPLFVIEMGSMVGVPLPGILVFEVYPLRIGWVHLVLVLPVIGVGYRIYIEGTRALMAGGPNMFSLITIGTVAAFFYSVWGLAMVISGVTATFDSYFPAVSTIVALMLMGRYLEARSRLRAGEAMGALLQLQPETAALIASDGERIIEVERIAVGDHLRVRNGARIPADGIVIEGASTVDESLLTGESLAVAKGVGDTVTGGSLNESGVLIIEARRVGRDAVLMQMVRLVETAQAARAPIARLADVVSGYFVPVVLCIGLVAGIGWLLAGQSLAFALQVFVAVLIIACPCSLGLATPAAIMVGAGRGAQLGILVKRPEALEAVEQLDTVVLDKTGTITEGKPQVVKISPASGCSEEQLLRLAAAVERGSEHPLGIAIIAAAVEREITIPDAEGFASTPGQGARATVAGQEVVVGNGAMMMAQGVVAVDTAAGRTLVYVAIDGLLAGTIALVDRSRSLSKAGVARLKAQGLEVVMLTGDSRAAAEVIATEVGIEVIHAEVLPGDKAATLQGMRADGRRVAMVGDGVNDAPALAAADVGIAVASGTDMAAESADMVLMHSRLTDVARVIDLSRAVMRIIRQNLFWAFFYNAVGIPVAAGVLYLFGGPLLNPMLASLAMAFSSVSVVANALRLRRFG